MKASENEFVNNRVSLLSDYQDEIAKNETLKKLLEADVSKLAERLAAFNFDRSVKTNFLTKAFYDPRDIKSVHLRNAAIAWAAGNHEAYNEHMRMLHEKLQQESEESYNEFENIAERLPHGPLRLFIHLLSLFTNMPEDIAKVLSAHTKLAWFKLVAKNRNFDRELNLAVDNPDTFVLAHKIATMPKNIKLKQMIDTLDDESKKAILTVCNTFQTMLDRAPKHIQKQVNDFKSENQHLIQDNNQEPPKEQEPQGPIVIDVKQA